MRRIAAAAQTAERRHPGIVPAGHAALFHKAAQLALAHHGIVDAETGKLDLARLGRHVAVLDDPVVERAVILVFERAERVRDAFQRVLNGVGEIVHREDAPLRALPVVLNVADAVEHRVAHVEVAACEIDLRAQRILAFGELPGAHPREEIKRFFDRAVAVRADGGVRRVAAVSGKLLGRQLADVGEALFDEADGELVGFLKVVRAVEKAVAPVEAEPADILLNGIDELGVLLGGVGVVHAQIAETAELLRRAEVDAQRLAVADVQIAVRLGRETGVHRFSGKPSAGGNVLGDKIMNKIAGFSDLFHIDSLHFMKAE